MIDNKLNPKELNACELFDRDLMTGHLLDGCAANITGLLSGANGVDGDTIGLQCLERDHGLHKTQQNEVSERSELKTLYDNMSE